VTTKSRKLTSTLHELKEILQGTLQVKLQDTLQDLLQVAATLTPQSLRRRMSLLPGLRITLQDLLQVKLQLHQ
jgi:hypothetical protein